MPGHEIPLATFVQTAEKTEAVIRSFSKDLFDGQLQFELLVLPPEEGSFLTRLGIVLAAGWAAVWSFTESDIGKAFIKGLTDHEPAYWSEMVGKSTKAAIENAEKLEADGPTPDCSFETLIVALTTTSFLQMQNDDLERVGVSTGRFRAAYEAKNAFYEACSSTPHLRGIGFSEEPIFPISKDDFSQLQIPLPPKEDELEPPWFLATMVLSVTSPNWDRTDRVRQWKGRDQQGRDRYFRIEDEEFWTRISSDTISTHVMDTMKVQLAYQGRSDHPKNCRVLRVLEFNSVELAKPLSDEVLLATLGRIGDLGDDNQGDLFQANPNGDRRRLSSN